MDTTLHAVCDNPECYYVGQVRPFPGFLRIGPGLFTRRGAFCECRLDIEMRIVAAPTPVSEDLGASLMAELGFVMEPPC